MAYEIGTAYIQVLPSFEKIERELKKGAEDLANKFGSAAEKSIPKAFVNAVKEGADEAEHEAEEGGRRSGAAFADHLTTTLRTRIEAMRRALPKVEIDGDSSPAERAVASIQARLEKLQGEDIKIGVNDAEVIRKVRRIAADLRRLEENAPTIQLKADAVAARVQAEAFLDGIDARAGAFARKFREEVKQAIAPLTSADVDLDTDPAAQKLHTLRRELELLSEKRISVDITEEQALKRLARVRDALAKIADESDSLELRFNADQSMQAIDRLYNTFVTSAEKAAKDAAEAQRKVDEAEQKRLERKAEAKLERDVERAEREAKQAAERAAKAAEEAFGKTFAGKVSDSLKSALDRLPDFDLAVNPSPAMLAIQAIREQLQSLAGKTIGVDIDEAEALRRIAELQAALVELARTDPSIQVHSDAAGAAADLATISTLAKRLNDSQIGLDVKVNGKNDVDAVGEAARLSLSRIEALVAGGLSIGTVLVPAAAAAAASIGFIGTAAAAAGAGIGAMVLGFSGIGEVVKQMQNLKDSQAKSAASFSRSAAQQESSVQRIAAAERSLANVRANNAEAARSAARAVADAERAVGDAREAAAEREATAQRDLTRVQVDAREAREALTRAYRDAVSAMADLDSAVKKNALDQREATLEIKKAKEDLDKFLLNPRATEEEREQARITYERRVLQIQDLKRQGQELADRQAEANRKGIEGSDQVVAARTRIAEADDRMATARRNLDKIQEEGAQRIAAAERRVADSRHAQQEQGRKAAYALAQANEAIASAARQAEQAQVRAGVAGGEAYDNLNTALSKLSPKAQNFARFIFSLSDDLLRLRAVAADNLLPGVQQSIQTLLPFLPKLSDFVGRVAAAIGDMFAATSRFLATDPTWRAFFSFISSSAVPMLQRLFVISRNVATGVAGLFLALTPFNDDLGSGLERLTERFAKWATTLKDNPTFQQFLAYAKENGPRVVELIGQLVTFVARFVAAAAPIAQVVLGGFVAFVEVLNKIPMSVLTELVVVLGLISGTMLVVSGAQRLFALWQGLVNTVAGRGTKIFQGLNTQLTVMRGEWVKSNGQSKLLYGALNTVNAGAGLAKRGLQGLVTMLGGPLGIAMSVAGIAIANLIGLYLEHKQKVESLTTSLGGLRQAYEEATRSGETSGRVAGEALRAAVRNNPELQKTVAALGEMGVNWEQFQNAILNGGGDLQTVLRAIDQEISRLKPSALDARKGMRALVGGNKETTDRIEQLKVLKSGLIEQAKAANVAVQADELMNATMGRQNDLLQIFNSQHGPLSVATYQKLASQYDTNAARINVLQGFLDAFNSTTSTAIQRSEALRAMIEQESGARMSAIEAQEAEAKSLANLSSTVESNRSALQAQVDAKKLSTIEADKQSKSLNVNTEAGRRNRDALEDAALAVRERYLQDIAAGKPMEEATKLHNDRITALVKEADKLGLDKKAAQELIDAYGGIPKNVKTVIESKGFEQVYDELQKLQFAQYALKYGLDPKDALAEFNRAKAAAKGMYPQGSGSAGLKPRGDGYGIAAQFFSEGGRVWGTGTSTSDDVLARLSNREFVQPTDTVDYYGLPFMEALRQRLLPKEILPGFSQGGSVTWPYSIGTAMTRVPGMDEVRRAVLDQIMGGTQSSGGIGSADMMRILRAVFPGLDLYSGYRPGSRTPSGSLSYHGMIAADGDPGRAVDLPPKREVFNWIHDHYLSGTRELIWAGDPYRNIWNGQHHKFSDSLLANHGVAGQPNAHIHWAYDSGGFLPPGVSTVWNGTGKPEPVFTEGQWSQISALVRNNHAEPSGGETHHWHFAKADLDHGRLNAWANARDAKARPGRPR